MTKKVVLVVFLTIFIIFILKNLILPSSSTEFDGRLKPCPRSPNCVSSESNDDKHFIEPLSCNCDDPISKIASFLEEHYTVKVVKKTPNYLRVVVTTKTLRFKDDLEFLYDPKKNQIDVRSSSRVGYSDGGVNRSRIEKLRKYLK